MMKLELLEESFQVELKKAEGGVPKSLYETISAFSNSAGGDIYLGIDEKKIKPNIVTGIKDVTKYKKEILATTNNREKCSNAVLNDHSFDEILLPNGRFVIKIHVDEAPRNRKPVYLNKNIMDSYKRLIDGDCQLSQDEIKGFLADNNSDAYDSLPNSRGYGMDYVNKNTVISYREMLNKYTPDNVFLSLDDEAFFKATALLQENELGKYVLSNAALLLFTSSDLIRTVFPFYAVDFIRKMTDGDKWDYRIASDDTTWSGNLFDFYLKVASSLCADIPSAYVDRNAINAGPSLMQGVVREALANALSNHSFFLNGSLSVTRLYNAIIIKNNGKSLTPIIEAYRGGLSRPRNPSIISAFRKIGVADRAGTGIPKMFAALEANHFPPLVLSETSYPVDKTILTISLVSTIETTGCYETRNRIVSALSASINGISISELQEKLSYSRTTISKSLQKMLADGIVKDNGKQTSAKRFYLVGKD